MRRTRWRRSFALGAVSLFVFPLIGHALGMSDHAYGLWVGLAVDNTAESTAAGALYSDAAGKFAVLAKTVRNATIGFVVLGYAIYWASRIRAATSATRRCSCGRNSRSCPGLVVVSGLATAGDSRSPSRRSGESVTLGLLADIRGRRIADQHPRTDEARLATAGVGVVGECAIAVITLLMVLVAASSFAL